MALLYDRILRHGKIIVNNKDTVWNWAFNMPCKSLKGILVLFEEEGSYTRDMSKFYNPKIQNVSVIVEGKPNQLYTQPLLELAISGRHRGHSLWLLTQSYTAVPNNIRRQAKMLYIWYPKNRTDLNTIHEENDVIGPEELARVKAQLKQGKHTCLIMRMEHPRVYMIR